MLNGATSRFAIRYGLVRGAVDTQAVFDAMFAASPASFWLDSNLVDAEAARFSFLGDDRGPLSETVIRRSGTVTVRDRWGSRVESDDIHAVLDSRLADRRIGPTSLPFEFVGGYVGYFSPAGAPGHEVVTPAGGDQPPDAMWMFADRIVAVDHQADLTYLLAVEDGRIGVRAAADAWIVNTMRRIRGLLSHRLAAAEPPATLSALGGQLSVDHLHDRYRQLRRSQPAPYAALLSFGETILLSGAAGSVMRVGAPGSPLTAAPAAHRPQPAIATGPIPAGAAACLRCCLLAALAAGVPHEPASEVAAPGRRPTSLGYFGLAGGVDLSLATPLATPRVTAAPSRRSTCPAAGDVEPAA